MSRAELLLIWKYLGATRRGILSLFSTFAVMGVGLGVGVLILVMGVMEGFQGELRRRMLGFNPHVVVIPAMGEMKDPQRIVRVASEDPDVVAASPYIFSKIIIRKNSFSDGIVIKGVDPQTEVNLDELTRAAVAGEIRLTGRNIVLGVGLASRLGAGIGDTVVLINPAGRRGPFGPTMRSRSYRVAGVFDAGIFDYNENLAFVNIQELRELLGMRGITGVELRLRNPERPEPAVRRLAAKLPGMRVLSWKDMNRSLFSALALEKLAMFVILTLITLVAAFNIIATLASLAIEKTWEIGVLRATGMTRWAIARVFMGVGVMLGLLGIGSGLLFGGGLGYLAGRYKLVKLPPDIYFIDYMPVKVNWGDVLWILGAALVISFFAAFIPAYRASRLSPVDAIAKGK